MESLISEPDVATEDEAEEEISVDPAVVTGTDSRTTAAAAATGAETTVMLVQGSDEIRLRETMYVPVMTAGTP